MRALLDVRAAGIPVIFLIGGANGCFGGMGIVARCADRLVISDIGRLAMSGPEVIEASAGVEEFDSRDRALVWRTTGGKHRFLLGDCDALVADDVQAFRDAAIAALSGGRPLSTASLEAEHALLAQRLITGAGADDSVELWRRSGFKQADRVADLNAAQLREMLARRDATPPLDSRPEERPR
jgi:malonate decarboxylase beta subunit